MPRPRRLTAEHGPLVAQMRAAGMPWKEIQRQMEARGLRASRASLWRVMMARPWRKPSPQRKAA
ncbi:MAG: hypothetical protein K2X74_00405 [Acetobacteraceae bacterium]|nr:hypothetical protein [Acetobacteraceae bacterium]